MTMTTYDYAKRPERTLSLDVFTPERPNGCAVLLLHGGGLLVGERQKMHAYAPVLTRLGFTAIAVSYRLRTEVLWPAPLDDVKAAYGWVRDHARELKVEPGKISIEGFSAGAILSLLAARDVAASAVVAFFPPADANRDPNHPFFLGAHLSAAEIEASAPLAAITPGYPPTMILHGLADRMVPPEAALALYAKLRSVGAKADLRLYADAVHEFSAEPSRIEQVQNDVAAFLDRVVVRPDFYAEESRSTNPFLQPGPPPALPRAFRG